MPTSAYVNDAADTVRCSSCGGISERLVDPAAGSETYFELPFARILSSGTTLAKLSDLPETWAKAYVCRTCTHFDFYAGWMAVVPKEQKRVVTSTTTRTTEEKVEPQKDAYTVVEP